MTFRPAVWQPIAVILSGLNLIGAGFAAGSAEPWHALGHAAVAVGFGFWGQRLSRRPAELDRALQLDVLEGEVSSLRQELTETQERLDFAERMLAQQGQEARRFGGER